MVHEEKSYESKVYDGVEGVNEGEDWVKKKPHLLLRFFIL